MDVEKVKLIVKNMESLLRCLQEEIYTQEKPENYVESSSRITPYDESDYDEVYLE